MIWVYEWVADCMDGCEEEAYGYDVNANMNNPMGTNGQAHIMGSSRASGGGLLLGALATRVR